MSSIQRACASLEEEPTYWANYADVYYRNIPGKKVFKVTTKWPTIQLKPYNSMDKDLHGIAIKFV
ncbi:hypothetical protein MUK42_25335 [Musa troglodytarum]|uniref:Uncharacterized protein n=1 Tax=Musa troglodytarum TaxID=320322 RepID=A0A9E7KFN2_9LILI|nr:hypothetical protein MUK42_25335 [Musa troglodytarum]